MGICSTCPSPLNFTIRFLLPTVVITTSCILGLCIVSDRPVFCGCSLPSTGTGRGGPRSTRPGSAFDAPTCRAGSVGRLCAARMISCLPRRHGSTRGTFYAQRCVDESIGAGSKHPGPQPQHKDHVCSCPGGIPKELAAGWLLRNVGSHAVCLPGYIFEARFICVEAFPDNCFAVGSRGATKKNRPKFQKR